MLLYLFPDLNYQTRYEQYINKIIYTSGYPKTDLYKDEKHFSRGKILGFKINKENCIKKFIHDCPLGTFGSPLISINTNVIGINIINESYNKNYGVFIGEIIENSNYNITFNNEEKKDKK